MPKKINYSELIKETLILTVAVAVIAAAVFFFLVPSHASVSSISGLGIVLSNFIPLQLSAITMILNVVLLIIGFLTCGKEFGIKTVYTSIMLPLFLGLLYIFYYDKPIYFFLIIYYSLNFEHFVHILFTNFSQSHHTIDTIQLYTLSIS